MTTDRDTRGTARRARLVVVTAGLLAAIFVSGTWVAPWLIRSEAPGSGWLHAVYAPLCHQNPERSLAIAGGSQAVCARCSGLYVGGVVGLLAAAALLVGTGRRPAPWILLAAVAPMLLDVLLPWVGLPGLPNLPRWILAIPPGFVAALFLAVGLEDIVSSRRSGANAAEEIGVGEVEAMDG